MFQEQMTCGEFPRAVQTPVILAPHPALAVKTLAPARKF